MTVWAGAIQPSHRFHFNQLLYISELFQTLVRIILWLCVQGPYSYSTNFILITYMDISELFQTFDKYNFVTLSVQGPYSHPTDFILISYIHELFQTFDKYNSVWLCVQGPHSHTTDFILITTPVSYMYVYLNEINSHFCGQIYPKLELSLLGILANRAHSKRNSTNSNNRLNNTI